jgi:hypothetical protein
MEKSRKIISNFGIYFIKGELFMYCFTKEFRLIGKTKASCLNSLAYSLALTFGSNSPNLVIADIDKTWETMVSNFKEDISSEGAIAEINYGDTYFVLNAVVIIQRLDINMEIRTNGDKD